MDLSSVIKNALDTAAENLQLPNSEMPTEGIQNLAKDIAAGMTSMTSMVFNNVTETLVNNSGDDISEDKSKIVRLIEDENVRPTINLDEISIDDGGDAKHMQGGGDKKNQMGIEYPIIRINDTVIPKQAISAMTISMDSILPTISLTLSYMDTHFISKNMPKDGDMISVFMRTNTSTLQYIRCDFMITDCSTSASSQLSGANTVNLYGELFVPGFNATYQSTGFVGTSKNVLRNIAKSLGIGFSFNDFDNTDDYQTWIRCNTGYTSFITHILTHAWKDEISFFNAWVDLYYNLCFVNVNKFLLTEDNPEDIDITVSSDILDMFHLLDGTSDESDTTAIIKLFTNSTDMKGTPFYISNWTPTNNSASISMSSGYSSYTHTFIHNPNLAAADTTKCFEVLENIPAYDQSKVDTHILLRGRTTYDREQNPENEQARVNYDFVNTYVKSIWSGIEYVMSDKDKGKAPTEWSGNVHKNYNRAVKHNSINEAELQKMYITIDCEGLNLQTMRGERVPVLIVFTDAQDNSAYNENYAQAGNDTSRNANRFYSGYYVISSIEYIYNPNRRNSISPFTTRFVLNRREWPTPEQI